MQKVLLADLSRLAADVLAKLSAKNTATVIALHGELGSGKTTFAQALGKELGIAGTMQSPTYVLMKKYEIKKASPFKTLIHIDAYRLENPKEFTALRPEQFLQDPKTLVVVEWPEKVEGALPSADLTLNFSSDPPAGEAGGTKEGERFIEMQK